MRKNYCWLILFALLSVLISSLIASCTPPEPETVPPQIEVVDQLGRTVKLNGIPQRIISLAPSNTEILFALGLGDKVVGVTDYCDYPPEAKEKPSIGGFSTPNIEKVVEAAPDLILATSIHASKIIPQLESRGLTTLALNPKTVDKVLEAILLTGKVTGTEKRASELVDSMRRRVEAVVDKMAGLAPEQRVKAFYVLWHDPLMTAGSGTLQDELMALAGGQNIAPDITNYANINLEAVLAANPGVIIAATTHGSMEDQTFQYAESENRLRDTDALRNGRVYAVDGNVVSRPGPRIVDGLELFARFLHPEIFGSPPGEPGAGK